MLWLIQRDFLEGLTVQQMVNSALEPVSNPTRDADIEQVAGSRICFYYIMKQPFIRINSCAWMIIAISAA